MADLRMGRWTAVRSEPHVVFIIGMRLNRIWAVHRWMPAFLAMPRMLDELSAKPELGFLGGKVWFARTIVQIQYWRSFEDLEAYAKARESMHLPAWAAFNRSAREGAVGIYHETYRVAPDQYENVYVDMPPTLFGAVGDVKAAVGSAAGARGRMTGAANPAIG